jgi:NAD(P)-dependent dehydrogenase (short-subunit alcohol dehydrogenase family)
MSGRVADKVAIVTGGASGIGMKTAQLLAQEGASVVVADIDQTKGQEVAAAIESAGGLACFVRTDVSDPSQVNDLIDKAVDRYGRLDVMHNNAFWAVLDNPAVETSDAEWDRTLAVSLTGAFYGCRAARPAMLANGGGVIINMSSVAGVKTSPRTAAYAAAKGGILSLTRSIALDYGRAGIRANAIAPGTIETPATTAVLSDDARRQYLTEKILMGRLGQPEDIAAAVLYLASEESAFMTGQVLTIDGGRSIS